MKYRLGCAFLLLGLLSEASLALGQNRLFCETSKASEGESYVFIMPISPTTQVSAEIYPAHGCAMFRNLGVLEGCENATMQYEGRQHFLIGCDSNFVIEVTQDKKGRLLGTAYMAEQERPVQCYVQPILQRK